MEKKILFRREEMKRLSRVLNRLTERMWSPITLTRREAEQKAYFFRIYFFPVY